MSLISRLFDAVRSWRGRREGRRTPKRAGVSMEYLDHRQLLSVNFTGNVTTDFPATESPGVVVLPNNPSVVHPVISDPTLAALIKVSGFDINGLRVSYTASDDTLSIGIEQPPSGQTGQPGAVIAGDADNNGNDGTVNPAVLAVEPTFQDSPDFGGSEYIGVFLDLKGTGQADVEAGYSQTDPRSPKQYQVVTLPVNSTGGSAFTPDFSVGTMQPQFTGNVYKVNSPAHPNLEFSITHFSQLYLQETGQALAPSSVIRLGGFAGSGEDTEVGEAFFPEQSFNLSQATVPPTTCPPLSPPILINPHENSHVNTAHPDLVRVNVLGSSGFDVTKIDPNTVTLGGAHPVFAFDRYINSDEWLDATFVFKGDDITLPRGFTQATVTGALTTGQTFSSTVRVFNRDRSFYSAAANAAQEQREQAREARQNGSVAVPASLQNAVADGAAAPLKVDYTAPAAPTTVAARPVVSIKTRQSASGGAAGPRLSSRMHESINRMAQTLGSAGVALDARASSKARGKPAVRPTRSAQSAAQVSSLSGGL
jgi:hypothetical protein